MASVALQVNNMANERKKTKSKKEISPATQGFGVPIAIAPHHFVVVIPRVSLASVQIIEDLGMHAEGDESELLDRVILPRQVWRQIASPVKRMFNERLKAHNLKPSLWKVGENQVDRLLGKELCVLAWAIEDLEPDKVGTALRNWLALRPEERWWLFGVTAATVGGLNDRGRGWRVALRYALGDTPQPTIRKSRHVAKKSQDDIYKTLPLFQLENT